ncbi:MAG: CPBP family intramembrane metalloprotease, partial [Sphingobacteriaceae bacterium]
MSNTVFIGIKSKPLPFGKGFFIEKLPVKSHYKITRMLNLLRSVSSSVLQIAAILPLLLLIRFKYSKKQKRLLILAGLVLIAEGLLTAGFNFNFLKSYWNWTGKSASLIAAVLFISYNPFVSKKLADFTGSLRINSLYPVFGFSGTLLLLRLIFKLVSGNNDHVNNLETFAFQATLPGLSEELIYRGILLGLLDKVYPKSISIFKARIGWSVLIVAIVFGLVHGLSLTRNWHVLFNTQKFCMTMGLGLAFAWVKQRSGSLWPAIVFHNLWNLVVFS